MRLVNICLVLSASLIIVLGQNVDYKGFKVYNVKFERKNQQDRFHLLKSDVVDYWRKPSLQRGIVGQAMVPPSHFDWFESQLEELGVERDVAIEDVYSFITENSKTNTAITSRNENEEFSFEGYHRFDEILNHINRLKEAYSNSTTISFDVVEAGRTEENRALIYIKLTSNNIVTTPKPIAVIEAGINPREWVTIPSALYVINKLLEEENVSLLDDFEWIVIPVLNPDGYEYSHTNLRLWTKNRSTRSNLGFICPGANLNRNFDIDWSASDSSSTPCSHIFAGVSPFSEEETQFLRSIFEEFGPKIGLYFSLQHSGGFISYPWQYEKAASGMFRQHLLLSRDMVAAMNETYDSGVGSLMHGERASGTSLDYARDKEVLYTFNVDIIPIGNSGVMVPESEIVSVAEDVWRAVYEAGNGFNKYR